MRNVSAYTLDDVVQIALSKMAEVAPKATKAFGNAMLQQIYDYWKDAAISAPAGSRMGWGRNYASTIQMIPFSSIDGEGRVFVDESDPNFQFVEKVEKGVKSWSIKEALLRGKAAQRNKAKHGRAFVAVPFYWRSPTKAGEGAPRGFFQKQLLPQDIYSAVSGGETISAGQAAQAGNVHMTGLKKYGKAGHSQFMTFRMVSENSRGWIYPDVPATPIFDQVRSVFEDMVKGALSAFVEGQMQKIKEDLEAMS